MIVLLEDGRFIEGLWFGPDQDIHTHCVIENGKHRHGVIHTAIANAIVLGFNSFIIVISSEIDEP